MDWHLTGLKPLSVNEAWLGAKRKSAAYRKYETHLLRTLPKDIEVPDGQLELHVKVHYSSRGSDIDNCLKPLIDILSKKYGFNDNKIYRLEIDKHIVKKGEETIAWKLMLHKDKR